METLARITPGAAHRLHAADGVDRTNQEGKVMKNLTRCVAAVTASSVAFLSAAALGAGLTTSAETSASAHVQRPTVSAGDYRWDHRVGYLLEQRSSRDEIRGWHHDGRDEISRAAEVETPWSERRWSL